MRDFRRLIVWQKAHHLGIELHGICAAYPPRRAPGLASQTRRAALSIAANIAEGCGHQGQREFARFLKIAAASTVELEHHLLVAREIGLLTTGKHAALEQRTTEVRRMLLALMARVLVAE